MDTFHPEENNFPEHEKEEGNFPCCLKECNQSFPTQKLMMHHVRNTHTGRDCDRESEEDMSEGQSDASDEDASDKESLLEEENHESADEEEDEEEEEEEGDPQLYEEIAMKAWKPYRAKFEDLVEKFMVDGESESDAKQNAYDFVVKAHRKTFREEYTNMLLKIQELKQDPTYRAVMKTAKRLREDDDHDTDESIRAAVSKRKHLINEFVAEDYRQYDDEEESDNDADDEGDE